MVQAINLLFASSRPLSWVNTAYPFAAGYLVMGGAVDTRFLAGVLFFLIPYNLLMYGVNDVFDYESDIRNPRKGSVEGAITPKKYHSLILWSSALLVLPFVAAHILNGTFVSSLVLLAVLFFVVAYSAKGLRFKEVPFLDSISSSLHFVGPLLFAYSLVGATPDGWIAAAAFFFWGVASQAFGAVQDIVPDRQAGIRSIATVLGARWTVWFALVGYTIACVVTALIGGYGLIVAAGGLAYVANVLPYLSITDEHSSLARGGWRRFMWLNYAVGAVVTVCLIAASL